MAAELKEEGDRSAEPPYKVLANCRQVDRHLHRLADADIVEWLDVVSGVEGGAGRHRVSAIFPDLSLHFLGFFQEIESWLQGRAVPHRLQGFSFIGNNQHFEFIHIGKSVLRVPFVTSPIIRVPDQCSPTPVQILQNKRAGADGVAPITHVSPLFRTASGFSRHSEATGRLHGFQNELRIGDPPFKNNREFVDGGNRNQIFK